MECHPWVHGFIKEQFSEESDARVGFVRIHEDMFCQHNTWDGRWIWEVETKDILSVVCELIAVPGFLFSPSLDILVPR